MRVLSGQISHKTSDLLPPSDYTDSNYYCTHSNKMLLFCSFFFFFVFFILERFQSSWMLNRKWSWRKIVNKNVNIKHFPLRGKNGKIEILGHLSNKFSQDCFKAPYYWFSMNSGPTVWVIMISDMIRGLQCSDCKWNPLNLCILLSPTVCELKDP